MAARRPSDAPGPRPTRLLAAAIVAAATVAAPVQAASGAGALPRHSLHQVRMTPAQGDVLLADLALDGRPITLRLAPRGLRAVDFTYVRIHADGTREVLPAPAPATYRGEIAGQPGSAVAATVRDGRVTAAIREADGEVWFVQPAREADPREPAEAHAVYRAGDLAAFPGDCGATLEHLLSQAPRLDSRAAPGALDAGPCAHEAQIAFEVDYPLFQLHGSSLQASLDDVETLLNAVEVVYARDLLISYSLTHVLVQASPGEDRYLGSDQNTLLGMFQGYWNQNQSGVARDVAHLVTGRAQGGNIVGVAWIGALCDPSYGHSWSQSDFASLAYRTGVAAHEIGHNWGALHCDGDPECSIMCSIIGGCSGNLVRFEEQSRLTMAAFRDQAACLSPGNGAATPNAPTAIADQGGVLAGGSLTLDVLGNDFDANCDDLTLIAFDGTSAHGGAVTRSLGTGPGGRDELHYAAPPGYEGDDAFAYTVEDGTARQASAEVRITVSGLRAPENPAGAESGLQARYYVMTPVDLASMPDYSTLVPFASDTVLSIDFPATGGAIATSGRADEVGAVFRGTLELAAGSYTFYTESDDGSLLQVDGQQVVDNDGGHGMQQRSGTVVLSAGTHAIRVEYFESAYDGGLIVRFEGPGIPKQVIGAERWSAPGVAVDYYDLASLRLPRFAGLSPYYQEIVPAPSIGLTAGPVLGSGRSDLVAMTLAGYFSVDVSDLYRFTLECDDGAALYVCETRVVNHDGSHGLSARSGYIGLAAGTHAFRVEYFEGVFDAALTVQIAGGGLSDQPVSPARCSHVGAFIARSEAPLGDPGDGRAACWSDYDGDGDDDLHVVNDGPDHLLRNDHESFTEVTAAPLGDAGPGRAAAWGDADGDGDLDLYLASGGGNRLFRNDAGSFADATAGALAYAGDTRDVAWIDFDRDGDLDLFLANGGATPGNRLLRNDGGGFVDATPGAMSGPMQSWAAAWGDADGDGDSDLYVVNDGPNHFFRNLGAGAFIEATGGPLGDGGSGRAAAWGDYDNDQDLDLALANTTGARLFRNDGESGFSDASVASGAGASGDFHGVAWADVDNDRDLDLYLSEGDGAPNLLLINSGGSFASAASGGLAATGATRAAAWADPDRDGDLDVYLAIEGGPDLLVENDVVNGHHWLQLDLRGVQSNRGAIGAWVQVTAGGVVQTREIGAGSGGGGKGSRIASFGLGAATAAGQVQVRWPSGGVQTLTGVGADQRIGVTEFTESGEPVQQTIVIDGINDFDAGNRFDDDGGDAQTAAYCSADPEMESPLDLGRVFLTNDDQYLYFGFEYDRDCFCDINLGLAIDVGTAAGGASDPFARQIAWSNLTRKPDFHLYDVVPTSCNGYNYEVLYRWNGAAWQTEIQGSNGLGIFDGPFTEGRIPLATLGVGAGDSIQVELFVTQEGATKGPLDAMCSDAVQLSTPGGTTWDVFAPVQMTCMKPFVILGSPVAAPEPAARAGLSLANPLPNPFIARATLEFHLPAAGRVRARVLDVGGREVARLVDGDRPAGPGRVAWDGRDAAGRSAPAGIYFLRVEAGAEGQARRVIKLE